MAHVEMKSEDHGDNHRDVGDHRVRRVTIEVNGNPVVLEEQVMNGLEIKQAAISQGVQIQLDFVLQLQRPNGEYDTIGDNDKVRVHKGMDFNCIAPDDNS